MKIKFIIPLTLAIVIGFISARMFYSLFNIEEDIKNNSYFIQIGAYTDKSVLDSVTKDLKAYITVDEGGKNYVYVGITTDKDNSLKIKKMYEEKGYNVYIKENYISNMTFYSNLVQYDILLSEVTKEEDLISISKVILSSYE